MGQLVLRERQRVTAGEKQWVVQETPQNLQQVAPGVPFQVFPVVGKGSRRPCISNLSKKNQNLWEKKASWSRMAFRSLATNLRTRPRVRSWGIGDSPGEWGRLALKLSCAFGLTQDSGGSGEARCVGLLPHGQGTSRVLPHAAWVREPPLPAYTAAKRLPLSGGCTAQASGTRGLSLGVAAGGKRVTCCCGS